MPRISNSLDSHKNMIKRTNAYGDQVGKEFDRAVNRILALNKMLPTLESGVMFSFDDVSNKKRNEVERALRELHSAVTLAIEAGIRTEWAEANKAADELVAKTFGKAALDDSRFSAYCRRNTEARDAFIARSNNGMNLSKRIWQHTRRLRDEMEVAMTVAIGEGMSASNMSRLVRKYLNDPELMFRRFRYKDENGNWQKKWKKAVRDEQGRKRWIDYDKDSYKVGRGVYKSSAKNAMRVARTETNMAYRTADAQRWGQMDFVLGIEVKVSKHHEKDAVSDICDQLAGKYPKDFLFTGWHPQCRCYCTTILPNWSEIAKMEDAIDAGTTYTPEGIITELPKGMRDFRKANRGNIAEAQKRGTLPYFIRDNAHRFGLRGIKPANVIQLGHEAKIVKFGKDKPLTIAERAKLRHDARTEEEKKAILERYEERRKANERITKVGNNVLKVAKDYAEVDYFALEKAIASGNIKAIQAETKVTAQHVLAMKKEEQAISGIIPDVHDWHKQFSLDELKAVHNAVKGKLASWNLLSLEEQAKKLKFEAVIFLGGNMNGVQQKYATWKVSQAAYSAKHELVEKQIFIKGLYPKIGEFEKMANAHPKAKKLPKYISSLKTAINEDKSQFEIASELAKVQKEYDKLHKKDSRKLNGVTFGEECYTTARKNNALWVTKKDADGFYDREEADKYYRKYAEKDWSIWTENQKDVAYLYTSGSSYINEPTYTTYYGTKKGLKKEIRNSWDDINTLTHMIEESEGFDRDIWLNRGASVGEFEGQFGVKIRDALNSQGNGNGLVGEQKPFLSTAHSKSWGFVGNGEKATAEVVYNIYCPKGTKGIYTEPYSAFGNCGRNWDGKIKKPLAYEVEVILQRGTKLRVTKVYQEGSRFFVDMEVIGQPAKIDNIP